MADYENPRKRANPFQSKAFSRYLGFSMVAIFVILAFVLFIWIAGGRKSNIPDEIDFIQIETPEDSAPVVVFETNIGTVKAVLFPEETPEYYTYFKGLVDSGYYDGTYICAVVDGAYALGGTKFSDPNGEYGEESDLTQIKEEISDNLWPLKGSLCSFVRSGFGTNYAGSSFIFVNDVTEVNAAYMDEGALKRAYGDELGGVFHDWGGVPTFSRKYTVFGQVYDGWDAFKAICSAETLETSQPASDIVFERVYMSTYGEEKPAE